MRKNGLIFGVGGGMADYFGIDPTIVRLVFVFLSLLGGTGILVYLAAAFVMPREGGGDLATEVKNELPEKLDEIKQKANQQLADKKKIKKLIFPIALLFLVFGSFSVIRFFFPIIAFPFWGFAFLFFGIILLWIIIRK